MSKARMTIDLSGKSFRFVGAGNAVTEAVIVALRANGANDADGTGDILIAAHPLLPDVEIDLVKLGAEAEAMAESGGRIVVLLSAMASVPMRRHVDYSAMMAAAYAQVRGLAMQFGPKLLVNTIGCGLIADADGATLTHVPLGYAGSTEDISDAVLFLCDPLNSYTTGQILMVDGGWSPGYGRNF
jgi:NAD(P)-dependent dehydrogenase (short-subunit alcohol dehydrogenase family)